MLFFIYKSLAVSSLGRDTFATFWKRLCWSLLWLWRGLWPDVDPDGNSWARGTTDHKRAGTPLAGGWYATLWSLRGDLEYFATTLGLPHPSSLQPCILCKATTTTLPWSDFRQNTAPWLATVWDRTAWELDHPERHPVFHLPGVSILSVCPDFLHTKHLGTDCYFYGSVLKFMSHHLLPGTPEENLGTIWQQVKQFYQAGKHYSQYSKQQVHRLVWICPCLCHLS